MTETTKTKKLRAPRNVKPVDAAPKPVKAKGNVSAKEPVAKPAKAQPVTHQIETSYTGPSTVMNARASRTAIDYSKFGTLTQAPLTDRDRKSLADLRKAFAKGAFPRANVDAGILRRMGERGYLEHVNGSPVAPDATFKLTARAFSKEAMA